MTTAEKTKYPGVYKDSNGNYFYQAYLGRDPVTGKKLLKNLVNQVMESHSQVLLKLMLNYQKSEHNIWNNVGKQIIVLQ